MPTSNFLVLRTKVEQTYTIGYIARNLVTLLVGNGGRLVFTDAEELELFIVQLRHAWNHSQRMEKLS